ncbi:hypothetical protein RF11_04945 [Thelohanellus kitauei]|uniref:Uncharacterized protein n=1 Tax=Thelohanellus kitauei TaxID=669202 RepID=A0A0C2J2I0_THEKT|nr:hypothetical protein RF11_04945 [Thelohanellus kitauei]
MCLNHSIIHVESMPIHEKTDELLSYFEYTYTKERCVRGREESYAPALIPTHTWNKFESAIEGIARTTNAVKGWHCVLQSLFMCRHPTMGTLFEGLKRDSCE